MDVGVEAAGGENFSFARGTGPDGSQMVAVNVRCLDEADVGALKPMPIDGKSL